MFSDGYETVGRDPFVAIAYTQSALNGTLRLKRSPVDLWRTEGGAPGGRSTCGVGEGSESPRAPGSRDTSRIQRRGRKRRCRAEVLHTHRARAVPDL